MSYWKRKAVTINDNDRDDWIENDEVLYLTVRRSRLSRRDFIRANRELIDARIRAGQPGQRAPLRVSAHVWPLGGAL